MATISRGQPLILLAYLRIKMSLLPFYRLETDRLVIRCYEPGDAEVMSATILRNHEHLIPWMPWAVKDQHTVPFCLNLIRTFRGNYDLGTDYPMAIFDRMDGNYVGGTGLHMRAGKGALEIGYWIDKDRCGQGFATHAAAALTKAAFEYGDIHRMNIHMQVGNEGSRRVPERLGYRMEGLLRQHYPLPDNQFADIHYYTMLREEYDASDFKPMNLKAFGFDGAEIMPGPLPKAIPT